MLMSMLYQKKKKLHDTTSILIDLLSEIIFFPFSLASWLMILFLSLTAYPFIIDDDSGNIFFIKKCYHLFEVL